MENTFDRIVEILRSQCDLDDSVQVTMDTTFKDIDLDSLDVVEVALECENEFGITIEVEEPPKTMGEFVQLVDSLMAEAKKLPRPTGSCPVRRGFYCLRFIPRMYSPPRLRESPPARPLTVPLPLPAQLLRPQASVHHWIANYL